MNKLNVFFEEKKVGMLYRDKELLYSFSYSEEWLNRNDAFPLSLAMPLSHKAFGNKVTLSFFENLLPEGDVRASLERSQNYTGTYELLKNFGSDCAGAVIVTADEVSPFKRSGKTQRVKINLKGIYSAIDQKRPVAAVIAAYESGYLSIAGAQDKFVAIYENGEFYLPTNGEPSTHIVKVPIDRSGVKESVYNEFYCMTLARRVGLNIPHCEVLDHEKYPLFIIERYDREKRTSVKRIHQQDFCQAQGFVSEAKYESNGGPSLKVNYQLIKSNVTIAKKSKALFDYLDWISFNLLTGNNDSHSENISLLLIEGKVELAPFYDLLCTAIYPKLKRSFSFFFGGRDDATRIGKNQFELVDKELDLKKGTMGKRVIVMSENLMREKDRLAEELKIQLPNAKILPRIAELIGKRCKNLSMQGLY